MKKIFTLLLAVIMLFTFMTACSVKVLDRKEEGKEYIKESDNKKPSEGFTKKEKATKVIRIGVFEPATGDSASGGKKEMLGIQYANSKTPTVEINGETYKVELVYGDNGSDVAKAPTAAAEIVSKGVSIVLGSYGSGVSIAGGNIFEDAGLAALGISCTNPYVTADNDYYYRICFLDPFQGSVLANFAVDKFAAKKAYLLGEMGNTYDQDLIAYFEAAFKEAGGEVVKASFPTGNSDFTTYLNQAKNEGADVIFTPVSINYAAQIIEQAEKQGIDIPFLGSDTLDDNKVLGAAKGTNVKLYVSTFYQEGGSPEFDKGIKEYINSNPDAKAANGGDDTISAVTAMGYDAYYVALEAIKKANSKDPADIKAALGSVTYTGVSGDIAFDEIGDAKRDTAFIKTADTANGTWVLEGKQTVEDLSVIDEVEVDEEKIKAEAEVAEGAN